MLVRKRLKVEENITRDFAKFDLSYVEFRNFCKEGWKVEGKQFIC